MGEIKETRGHVTGHTVRHSQLWKPQDKHTHSGIHTLNTSHWPGSGHDWAKHISICEIINNNCLQFRRWKQNYISTWLVRSCEMEPGGGTFG